MTDPWKDFVVFMIFVYVVAFLSGLYLLYAVICPAVWSV